MKRLQLCLNDQQLKHRRRIAYVMDFLCAHPLANQQLTYQINGAADAAAVRIAYATEEPNTAFDFFIPAQSIAFADSIPRFAELQANRFSYANQSLYGISYTQQAPRVFFTQKAFAFDWIETIFFHISRYEEYHCVANQMDTWDMMKKEEQFLSKNDLHRQPIVDHLVFACLEIFGLAPKRLATTYCMTHDIDAVWKFPSLWKYIRAAARQGLKDRRLTSQVQLLSAYWQSLRGQQKDPYDTFDWLLRKESGFEKIIYWLTGGITRYDHFFDIRHPYVAELLQLARDRGYHIGLHPSYAAYQREDLLIQEITTLEAVGKQEIQYNRQHFLHIHFGETWQLLEKAKIKEDASLGYQDILGFRCGTGFPYHLYNFDKEQAFFFKERPLVVMDTAVLMDCHDDASKAIEQIEAFLQANEELTHITFNFHNSTFDPLRLNAELFKDFYDRLCAQLSR